MARPIEPRFYPGDLVRLKPGAVVAATFERCAVCGRRHQSEAIVNEADPPDLVDDIIRVAEVCDPCWAWAVMFEADRRLVTPESV